MSIEHDEARWVAFTQYSTAGRTWNVTIREGIDPDEIDQMIAMIADATNRIASVADAVPDRDRPVQNSVGSSKNWEGSGNTGGGVFGRPGPSQGPSSASGNVSGPQVSDVSKVVITGTREQPLVEMYSPNDKLKFPVFKVPSNRVATLLQERYPQLTAEQTSVMYDCGLQFPVQWSVHWVPSPKNAKWKDLITIVQDDLEV
jgi:hypothetical protein